jgi:hypothetical protein
MHPDRMDGNAFDDPKGALDLHSRVSLKCGHNKQLRVSIDNLEGPRLRATYGA